jgi:hypothetical protein
VASALFHVARDSPTAQGRAATFRAISIIVGCAAMHVRQGRFVRGVRVWFRVVLASPIVRAFAAIPKAI